MIVTVLMWILGIFGVLCIGIGLWGYGYLTGQRDMIRDMNAHVKELSEEEIRDDMERIIKLRQERNTDELNLD